MQMLLLEAYHQVGNKGSGARSVHSSVVGENTPVFSGVYLVHVQ